jgi:hypothetical protein
VERKAVACGHFLLRLRVPSCPLWLSGFPMSAIFTSICLCSQPCTIESTDPTPPFSCFCCKQRRFPQSSLGPPLGDAWVALGPRLGHPRAIQSQTQSQSQQAEGRKILKKHKTQRFPRCVHSSILAISPCPAFCPINKYDGSQARLL